MTRRDRNRNDAADHSGEYLVPLGVLVPHAWRARLTAHAERRGMSRSELVREVIDAWLRVEVEFVPPPEVGRPEAEG